MEYADLCDLLEGVLLGVFADTEDGKSIVLSSQLVNDIVGFCFSTYNSAGAAAAPTVHRLHGVGIKLFNEAFIPQKGFLPQESIQSGTTGNIHLEIPFSSDPIVLNVSGSCLWDKKGILDVSLLRAVTIGRLLSHKRGK